MIARTVHFLLVDCENSSSLNLEPLVFDCKNSSFLVIWLREQIVLDLLLYWFYLTTSTVDSWITCYLTRRKAYIWLRGQFLYDSDSDPPSLTASQFLSISYIYLSFMREIFLYKCWKKFHKSALNECMTEGWTIQRLIILKIIIWPKIDTLFYLSYK